MHENCMMSINLLDAAMEEALFLRLRSYGGARES